MKTNEQPKNPTPQTLTHIGSKNHSGKLFRDGDPPIYLLDDGRFAVQVGERWIVKASVKAIEAVVAKGAPFLRVFQVDPDISFRSREVRLIQVSAILESKIVDQDGKKQYHGYGSMYVHDDVIVEKLRDLEKRREKIERELNKEMEAIMKKAKRVYRGNFEEMLEEHGALK